MTVCKVPAIRHDSPCLRLLPAGLPKKLRMSALFLLCQRRGATQAESSTSVGGAHACCMRIMHSYAVACRLSPPIRAACPLADSSNPSHHCCCTPKRYGALPRRRRSWQILLPLTVQLRLMRACPSKWGDALMSRSSTRARQPSRSTLPLSCAGTRKREGTIRA